MHSVPNLDDAIDFIRAKEASRCWRYFFLHHTDYQASSSLVRVHLCLLQPVAILAALFAIIETGND